jgi:hypothetical protein
MEWFSVGEMRHLTNIVDCDYGLFGQQAITGEAS